MHKILGKGTAVEMYRKLESTMRVDVDLLSETDEEKEDDHNYSMSDEDGGETPDPDKLFGIDEAQDIVFTTEVDPAMFKKHSARGSANEIAGSTHAGASTRMQMTSEAESRNARVSQAETAEVLEINHVLKSIMAKEHPTGLYFEEIILEKKKKLNKSRGWSRPTGVKIAPMTILGSS